MDSTSNASAALTAIDLAIAGTDGSRAHWVQHLNRLDYAVNSLVNTRSMPKPQDRVFWIRITGRKRRN